MRLAFSFVANAAEVGPDGRFYVIGGGIDQILVESFPTILTMLSAVVGLQYTSEDVGIKRKLTLTVTCPGGTDSGIFSSLEPKPEECR